MGGSRNFFRGKKSRLVYSGEGFRTGFQIRGSDFSKDGSYLYVIRHNPDNIYRYELATPFNVSTAGTRTVSTIAVGTDSGQSVFISDDGTRVYAINSSSNSTDNVIRQFALSTAFDITTMSLVNSSSSFGGTSLNSSTLWISQDGLSLYLNLLTSIRKYTFGTAWDITDITLDYSVQSTLITGSTSHAICLTQDETNFYSYNEIEGITQAKLATAGDLRTYVRQRTVEIPATYNDDFNFASLKINDDGTKFLLSGFTNLSDNLRVFDLTIPFKLGKFEVDSNLEYLGDRFKDEDLTVRGMDFSKDGGFMYVTTTNMSVVDQPNDYVYRYELSTAFSVSTAGTRTVSNISVGFNINGIFISDDGTRVYVANGGGSFANPNTIGQFALSTAFDITTMSLVDRSSDFVFTLSNTDLWISQDGLRLYITRSARIQQYSFGTAWDITDLTLVDNLTADGLSRGVCLSNDESYLYFYEGTSNNICQYILQTPTDLSTAIKVKTVGVGLTIDDDPENVRTIKINDTGRNIYISDSGSIADYDVYSYRLKVRFEIGELEIQSDVVFADAFAPDSQILGFDLSQDGTYLFLFSDEGEDGTLLNRYELSTPFDVSTATNKTTSVDDSVISGDDVRGLWVSDDGLALGFLGEKKSYGYIFTGTAFDVTELDYSDEGDEVLTDDENFWVTQDGNSIYLTNGTTVVKSGLSFPFAISNFPGTGQTFSPGEGELKGICLSENEENMYLYAKGSLFQYRLTTPGDPTTAIKIGTTVISETYDNTGDFYGLRINDDGDKIFIVSYDSAYETENDEGSNVSSYTISNPYYLGE